jgi:hypothetical protein
MDCFERTGVERLMDGRLRAAGLMSTMVVGARGVWPATDKRERARDAVGESAERRASGPSRARCCTIVGRSRVHLRIKI